MIHDLSIRGLAENTHKSYLQAVTGLARYYRRSPDQLCAQQVQAYLLWLHQERHLSWQSCNAIRHGLRFFYRITLGWPETHFYLPGAKEPSKLPEVLSHEELVRLFTVTTNRKQRALLMTTYAAGLRASAGHLMLHTLEALENRFREAPHLIRRLSPQSTTQALNGRFDQPSDSEMAQFNSRRAQLWATPTPWRG
jgi:site-specific recombinase XerD